MRRAIAEKIKSGTVALGLFDETAEGRPFVTFGSGFCVDARGAIITCRHVLEAFNEKDFATLIRSLPASEGSDTLQEIPDMRAARPFVFFYQSKLSKDDLYVFPVPVEAGMAATDFDLGVVRIPKHKAFPEGYPSLDIANFDDVYEGVEVGTCGFPLGNGLEEQIGTITSSFTFGRVSSLIPAQDAPLEHLQGFQLDITATHGNSGGPVFIVSSGSVFGVLQRGVIGSDGKTILPGITKAEPVYRLTHDTNDILSRIMTLSANDFQR